MLFARRNRLSRGASLGKRSKHPPKYMLELLESRLLLSGETTVIAWGGQLLEAAKDQYIVSANAATAAALQQTLADKGLHVDRVVPLGTNVWAIVDTADSIAALQQWGAANPSISLAPNLVYHKAAVAASDVTAADWQYLNTGQSVNGFIGLPGADISATLAWGLTTGAVNNSGVTSPSAPIIAVLDTGLDLANADLANNIWINPRESPTNGLDNDGNGIINDINGANFSGILGGTLPTNVVTDTGHGNDIAGLIGALGNNAVGTAGVAWHVKILPVVVFTGTDETTATDASIIAGLEYVMALKRRGVNIVAINMSFGRRYLGIASGIGDIMGNPGTAAAGVTDAPAINVFDAMKRAADLGIIIVTAAGNSSTNDDTDYFVPANFNHALGITVAATTNLDTISTYSNYGPQSVEIAAPGDNINALSGLVSGSSYAAALVTGEIALLKSFRPSLTPSQIVSYILNGADIIPGLTPYVQNGRRLNLIRPLEMVLGNPAPLASVDLINGSGAAGWLYDQNLGYESITGSVYVDGNPVYVTTSTTDTAGTVTAVSGLTFTANALRPDLTYCLGPVNHGFQFRFNSALTAGPHRVQIYLNDAAIDPATGRLILQTNSTLPALTPVLVYDKTIQSFTVTGALDTLTSTGLSGWLFDQNNNFGANPAAGFVKLQINSTDTTMTTVYVTDPATGLKGPTFTAANNRPDLTSFLGTATHGFAVNFSSMLSLGSHRVELWLNQTSIDPLTGGTLFQSGSTNPVYTPVLVASRTVQGAPIFAGAVDTLTYKGLSGWLYDQNLGAGAATGHVLVDGIQVRVTNAATGVSGLTFTATDARPDLTVPLGSANHGFQLNFASFLPAGTHNIKVYLEQTSVDPITGDVLMVSVTSPTGIIVPGTSPIMTTVVPPFYDATYVSASLPQGTIDGATNAGLSGWLFDQNVNTSAATGYIVVDGLQKFVTNTATGARGLTFTAGNNRADLTPFLGTPNHGFQLQYDSFLTLGSHTVELWLDATSPDGAGGIILQPNSTQPVFTPVRLVSKTVTVASYPIGYVDTFTNTGMSGWMFDQNLSTTAATGIVKIDGVQVNLINPATGVSSPTFTAGNNRADLVPFLGSANHGFTFNFANFLTQGSHTVEVFLNATSVDPTTHAVLLQSNSLVPLLHTASFYAGVVVGHPKEYGAVENLTITGITGWLFDQNFATSAATGFVTVQLNPNSTVMTMVSTIDLAGAKSLAITAGNNRPDLVARLGSANHGFQVNFNNYVLPLGTHLVEVYINVSTNDPVTGAVILQPGSTLPVLSPLLLYRGSVQSTPQPLGAVDTIDENGLTGWLFDQNLGAASTTGIIKVDGTQFYVIDTATGLSGLTFSAAIARPDLTASLGSPNHGFSVNFNAYLSAGSHNIEVYLNATSVNPVTGNLLLQTNATSPVLTPVLSPVLVYTGTVQGNVKTKGAVDSSDSFGIAGWLYDQNFSTTPALGVLKLQNDTNSAAMTAVWTIDLNAGNTKGPTFTAAIPRSDLLPYLGTSNHGFQIKFNQLLSEGSHNFELYLYRPSVDPLTGARILQTNSTAPVMVQELVTSGTVTSHLLKMGDVTTLSPTDIYGWCFDQNFSGNSVTGIIKIDGAQANVEGLPTFPAGNTVPDLLPTIGSTNHGFHLIFNNYLTPVGHFVQLYVNKTALNPVTGDPLLDNASNPILTPVLFYSNTVQGNVMPTGGVDSATYAGGFTGWATDANLGDSPTEVRIDIDGSPFMTLAADQNHTTAPVGNHGFNVPNPRTTNNPTDPWIPAGAHRVDFYALDDYTGDAVLIGSTTIVGDEYSPSGSASYNPATRIITGTVYDLDNVYDPVSIQVVIDGINGSRQYLNEATFGGTSNTFSITVPLLVPGDHEIRLLAFDTETGAASEFFHVYAPSHANPTGSFDTASADVFDGWVTGGFDTTTWYRIDVDGYQGEIGYANGVRTDRSPNNTIVGFNVIPPTLSGGTHTAALYAFDSERLTSTLIATKTFKVGTANKVPNGAIDPGPNNTTGIQVAGITGWAQDPTSNDTASAKSTVSLLVDNATTAFLSVVANRGRTDDKDGYGFAFSRLQLATLAPGFHFVQVVVVDNTNPTIQVQIGQGELQIGAVKPSGTLTDVNFRTLEGAAQGAYNDFSPLFNPISTYIDPLNPLNATFSYSQPIFLVTVSNAVASYYQTFLPTPPTPPSLLVPTVSSTFSLVTPLLTITNGNTVTLQYFDPISGALIQLGRKTIATRPVEQFVNGGLILSPTLPVGALDIASQDAISGWVADPDAPAVSIQYRIDIDGAIIGQAATALDPDSADLYNSTLFSQAKNQNHGFTIIPPNLTPGTHTATVWAFDNETKQPVAIATRTFTVLDPVNRKPVGTVDAFTNSTIAGWAQDPSSAGAATTVSLYVDSGTGPTLLSTTTANLVRTDAYSGHGFSFNLASLSTLTAGEHYFSIQVTDLTDPLMQVTIKSGILEIPTLAKPLQLAGSFNVVDFQTISGTVTAPVNDLTPVFQLNLNGAPLQIINQTTSTFSFTAPPLAPTAAVNTYTLLYVDKLTGQTILLATRTLLSESVVVGAINILDLTQISGWAYSPSLLDAKIHIQVLVDNVPAMVMVALLDRPDLTGNQVGHAFQAAMPTLSPGSHVISIRTLDPISGDYQLLDARTVIAS